MDAIDVLQDPRKRTTYIAMCGLILQANSRKELHRLAELFVQDRRDYPADWTEDVRQSVLIVFKTRLSEVSDG